MVQRTLALIKPEGLAQGHTACAIIDYISEAGLRIYSSKTVKPSKSLVETHYAEHRDEDCFELLLLGMVSRQVEAMVLEHPSAVAHWRSVMGPFQEGERIKGTIRGDLMRRGRPLHLDYVHGSDSLESAEREIRLWFPDYSD